VKKDGVVGGEVGSLRIPGPPCHDDARLVRGGVGNSHILIQHSAEFGVRLLLSKIPRNVPS
jgi:hypothetical protein